ncbi:MAG: ABC transporter ATP-binding protein [Oscillospiraceae bacterium]|nr:ABC transporter ATP-binding protein [Oscillospiraceae bacterium]
MLDVKDLVVSFPARPGRSAVNGLSFHMDAGERLGLVGESGSGKTVTALTIAGLIRRSDTVTTGTVRFLGQDMLHADRQALRRIQGREIGMVFQEPMTSMNPLMKVGKQVEEGLLLHTSLSDQARRAQALAAIAAAELQEPERIYNAYPHQLSGGQRQRVMIAAAIITNPKLLIADEPTTALDVTVQKQILTLLRRVSEEREMGILFISHNLAVVRRLCSRVAVLRQGVLVELGETEQIFSAPRESYTKELIDAIPTRRRKHA